MELTSEEEQVRDHACEYIKEHEQELIEQFIVSKNPLRIGLTTIFTAGSPGAGKTEFSKRFIPLLHKKDDEAVLDILKSRGFDDLDFDTLIVRIDVDEIRDFIPQYKKSDISTGAKANAHVIQKAANKGLDILRDYCLKNNISFLHDGTFGNYSTMREIIKKSIKDGRVVYIYYIYIDPVEAWKFTKAREYMEGRNIVKEKFIEQYFNSKENIQKIKNEFNKEVRINCVLKDKNNEVIDIDFNNANIDQYLKTQYNKGVIKQYTAEELSNLLN